jgi:hypothetical protein
MGATPHRPAKEASLPDLLGSSLRPRSRASRHSRYRDSRQRDQLRGGSRHQPVEVRVQLGYLFGEGLVAAGHRTQREPGRRRYVAGIICEAEARGHRDELFRRESAQTVEEFVGCPQAQGPELVCGLHPGFDRGATGSSAQGPDHLHASVGALGHPPGYSQRGRAILRTSSLWSSANALGPPPMSRRSPHGMMGQNALEQPQQRREVDDACLR